MSDIDDQEWLAVLRDECDKPGESQKTVGKRLGVSSTMISQALNGTYPSPQYLQQRVEGALMSQTVDCPVIGELPRNRCLEYQRRKFAATNPMRVALSVACKTCPNRRA